MILVDQLTKRYGRYTAVDSISFSVRPGTVTGFLGPNGAGKSTTMRVMVGLTVPTSGTATINGERFADLPNPGLEVGVLLDASAQHSGRTGREILTIAADTMGLPRRRVDEMLELVSLTPSEAKRRVRNYSLGMRQRLGIGTALLGDPRVLILDEPANGLDPAGIRWMRDLLTGFASQGGTVLLSSHLLHEIEVIADDLVVIGNGKIVASGSKEELLAAAGTLVRSTSPRDLAHALERAGIPSTLAGDGSVRTDADPARVGAVALTAGIALTELRSAEGNGLDPAGIRWMRDLLTDFASQGGTVLLSSHLLHEIEVIADDLVVIGNGRIVAAGSKEELLAAAGTLARSTSPRDLAHALEQAGIPSTLAGDGSVRTDADPARVGAVALTAGIPLTELRSAEGTGLEDMFLSLTADAQREGVAA